LSLALDLISAAMPTFPLQVVSPSVPNCAHNASLDLKNSNKVNELSDKLYLIVSNIVITNEGFKNRI
jgi:hypothetical protein